MGINRVFEMNEQERANLTDEQIGDLAYGIRYYEPYGVANDEALRQLAICRELKARLESIEARKAAPQSATSRTVRCACGHTIGATLAMSTARGTACPDCYDRMSE